MVFQLRSQIMNRISLARARRSVKQNPLSHLKLQRLYLLSGHHECGYIVVEHRKSFLGQDHTVAVDLGQTVHFDHAAATQWIDVAFQRDDSPPIGSALADQKFEFAEKLL